MMRFKFGFIAIPDFWVRYGNCATLLYPLDNYDWYTTSTDSLILSFYHPRYCSLPPGHFGWAAVTDSRGDKPLPWGSFNRCMDTLADKQLPHCIQTRQPISALLLSPPVCKSDQEFTEKHSSASGDGESIVHRIEK